MAIKNFDDVQLYTTFTTASSHDDNIVSGENIAISLGKIAKWKEDFDGIVFDGHPTYTQQNSTSSVEPKPEETFTVIDSITRNDFGHITGVNTKTVKLPPGSGYYHPTVTPDDTTTTETATYSGEITMVDSVVRDECGHVEGINIKTVTLPAEYTHPTGAGNKHIPSGGSSGQFLKYSASGTAVWHTLTKSDIPALDYVSSTTTRNANTVLAGPSSGNAAAPTFRALVAADLPSHTHTKSQITDFPTSLKNPNSLSIQGNGTTSFTYDGSSAKTLNIKSGTGISVSSDTSGNITITNTSTNTDTKTKASNLTPSSATNYNIFFGSGSTMESTADTVKYNNGIYYQTSEGTTSSTGNALLILGNTSKGNVAGNKSGRVFVYYSAPDHHTAKSILDVRDVEIGLTCSVIKAYRPLNNTGTAISYSGGSGLTIIGAGESASAYMGLRVGVNAYYNSGKIYSDAAKTTEITPINGYLYHDPSTNKNYIASGTTLSESTITDWRTESNGTENMLVTSDGSIDFLTNCNTIANRKRARLDANLYFYPETTNTGSIGNSTHIWNTVYARSIKAYTAGGDDVYFDWMRAGSGNYSYRLLDTGGQLQLRTDAYYDTSTSAWTDSGDINKTTILTIYKENTESKHFLNFNGKIVAPTFVGALSGNATSATKLATARTINGVSFNGTANIIIPRSTKHIHACSGTEGSSGYVKFMTIKATDAYANHPVDITMSQRSIPPYKLRLMFVSKNSTDVDFGFCTLEYNARPTVPQLYYVKTNTGTYDFYVRKVEGYDHIYILDVEKADGSEGSRYSITWQNVHASSLPTGYVQVETDSYARSIGANGYWGMATPAGKTDEWIRTTTKGIIPYQEGAAGNGHCQLGTSTWWFSSAWIDTVNGNLSGNATTSTKATYVNMSRYTKDSKSLPGQHNVVFEEYTSTSANLPTSAYYHIISMTGDDTRYGTQIATGMTTNGKLYIRNYNNSTWTAWTELVGMGANAVTRSVNTVLAGPASGSTAAAPTFRALVTADLPASGATAGSYGPSANASPAHSGTFSVPYITVNAKGQVTAASTKTITLPASGNTDTKVTQTITTTAADYRLLFSGTADDTTRTEGARKATTLLYNPSTNRLTIRGGTTDTIAYGMTGPGIKFLNSASSQGIELVYTDYNSYYNPTSLTLIGDPGNGDPNRVAFIAPRLVARDHKNGCAVGDLYIATTGTAATTSADSTLGETVFRLGNNIAAGTKGTTIGAGNSRGRLRIYGENAYYVDLLPSEKLTSVNRTIYIPNTNGTLLTTDNLILSQSSDANPLGYIVTSGNTGNYQWHLLCKIGPVTTKGYYDYTCMFRLTQYYSGGGSGVYKVSLRCNNTTAGSVSVWLISGEPYSANMSNIQFGYDNTAGNNYVYVFVKMGAYGRTIMTPIFNHGGAVFYNSIENNDTTSTDSKGSTYCYASLSTAATSLLGKAFANTGTASNRLHVYTYDSAASREANTVLAAPNGSNGAATFRALVAADLPSHTHASLSTSAGSATRPVYFSDGKPVAGTYTLGDACTRSVKTASGATHSNWDRNATDDKIVPTMSFIAFWNGAYNANGTSNLAYCKHGAFGNIVKYTAAVSTSDTWGKVPVIGSGDGVMEVGKHIDFHIVDGSTVDYDVRLTASADGLALDNKKTMTFTYGGRKTIVGQSGMAITTDTSSSWASGIVYKTSDGNNTTIGAIGMYGTQNATAVTYAYIGKTYDAPWLKIEPNGTVTAKTFSGNATSATKLATARTINGVSFNGTSNISIIKTLYNSTGGATVTLSETAANFDLLIIIASTPSGNVTLLHRTNTQYVRHPYCTYPNPGSSVASGSSVGNMMSNVNGTSVNVTVSSILISGTSSAASSASSSKTSTITEVYGIKFS